MYVCMYVCMYECMHVCMYVCVYVCMYKCMFVCMNVCMYVCMNVCMNVCMYSYFSSACACSFHMRSFTATTISNSFTSCEEVIDATLPFFGGIFRTS